MIGKVGRSRQAAKGGAGSNGSQFRDIITYISRDADGKGRMVAPGEMGVLNLPLGTDEMAMNVEMMDIAARQTQKNGKFKGDPVYHLVLSWRENDSPNAKQVEDCVKHTLKALGMQECQAVWAIHRDTDDDHVHIAVNRVHPAKGIVVGPPHHDYFIIDKAMRELEIKHGFERDNGPYITVDTPAGPEIVRMSRKERLEKGLLKGGDEMGPSTTQSARQAERNQGAESFQRWAQGEPAHALMDALKSPSATWDDLHEALAAYGMKLKPKGTGMVVTTEMGERTLACPLSKLDRSLTRMKLEERLGAFEPLSNSSSLPPPTTTYKDFLNHAQAHGSEHDGPKPHDDRSGKRARRRAERAQAREALHQRYRQEKEHIKATRRDTRKSLLERQAAERKALAEDHRIRRKPQFIAQKMALGMDRQMATGLWAYQAAREKEELQKRQLKERMALPRGLVWRDWLEQEAAKEDEAALSALRGIRYRERRKENQEKNGIEGEEVDALKPMLKTLTTRVDRRRQKIHYLDASGKMLFTDTGPRIDVHDKADTSVEAALRLAAQKYGAVDITGSAAFREQAARQAARMGIKVRDKDLQGVWQKELEAGLSRVSRPSHGEHPGRK
ncbi:TraI/MobA(P) family conjugative relaxase [Acidithiobacillus caldus]|uniref:TraI/MobA(P) family conjugative relaxase n=1 Tax=Acidithiobacillus caldus TaxID=33059 RepID=UPI001C069842|nr:TraI/MobA(P) family conjugative relaxase [Acidithiobacillus caldus]MBU2770098.1 relaxase/mobilization nuclease domain-containing protein [Acidithiobacillus caldus]